MIFKDDTLYIDLKGDMDIIDLNVLKERIFSILSQYDIDNVILNTNGAFNLDKRAINSIKRECQTKYFGSFKIM